MSTTLRWGILATGNIARKFAQELPTSRTGRLVAVGSRTNEAAEKFAQEFGGVRAHGSYAALLADPTVDAIYLSTPHPSHLEWTLRAIAAGKHVLCEKPLALRGRDVAQMVSAARTREVFLMEAFMYRCHPQTEKIAALLGDGAIGRLRVIRAAFCFDRTFDPAHRLYNRELGGGGILDIGCYPVSYARRMAGAASGLPLAEPEQFKAVGSRLAQTGVDDYAAAVAVFPGDVIAELSCGTTVRRDISVTLHGESGAIEIPSPYHPGGVAGTDRFTLWRKGRDAEIIESPTNVRLYALEADAVADAIATGAIESPAMSHADSLGNAAVLDDWLAQVGVTYP
jgi:predicted dehydrogenase